MNKVGGAVEREEKRSDDGETDRCGGEIASASKEPDYTADVDSIQ